MDINTSSSSSKLLSNKGVAGLKLSTNDIPPRERQEWLREVICREYAHVAITSPAKDAMFQNLVIYPWNNLQLSVIRSSALTIERLPQEPYLHSQDAYFAVILVSGDYLMMQNGREVFLQPGDMTIYDATRPHRIQCPKDFTKLIISIPRARFRDRIAGIDNCTALRIPGTVGAGLIASNFLRSLASQTDHLKAYEFSTLSDHALDLLTLAVASVRPVDYSLSRSRTITINRIKAFIEQRLADSTINSTMIANCVGLSSRYINDLFADEGTSLMRYVWKRRLENCRKDMLNPVHVGHRLSDIAFRWGFNDLSHFSRAFKQQFGCSPREFRHVEA
ncbi:helix-turn-helix domain-containing protein [Methylophaga sp.]|uniref:AraC-like ligand-binding domain-containing protein n=1 Tax=Methylophaga sp. TaxID=2024840 RepID=UPI002726E38C|nr:helix-turn-helix domain-containing protein [Methylophaga sp.]MDO8827837.1 helix-turn-helix domain-containing protein [Methylophaga sp.]